MGIAAPLLAIAAALDPSFLPPDAQPAAEGATSGSSSSGSEGPHRRSTSPGALGAGAAVGGRRGTVTAELEALLAADSSLWGIAAALRGEPVS